LASAQTIETAHTNHMQNGECANYAAHSPIKERRNKEVTSKERLRRIRRYRNSSAA
jgi:hypothetical protein